MSTINDGGPAFPRLGEGFGNPNYDHAGMTLRDYFAAAALQGMCADPNWGTPCLSHSQGETDPSRYIKIATENAYQIADAMLVEREKGGGK